MKRQIDSLVAGSSFPAIAASDIVDLEINLPKMQEQLRVALLLKNQDSEIVTLQKMAQCLKLEKQALMAQLLMGKRRIRLPVSETAAQV
jgi:type I restriction enzyme S subunit